MLAVWRVYLIYLFNLIFFTQLNTIPEGTMADIGNMS